MIRFLKTRVLLLLVTALTGLIYFTFFRNVVQHPDVIIHLENDELKEYMGVMNPKQTVIESPNRVKAAFVILARNEDLDEFKSSMRMLEDTFNKKFNYPYVFLNDKPFDDEFKEGVKSLTNAKIEFGLIPEEHWSIPKFLDKKKVLKSIEAQKDKAPYGGVLSYHHMIRYESGLFSEHELTQKYDYYWRVEPGVEFFCEVDDDPFLYMHKNNKKYGFTIMMSEFMDTIPTLYKTVQDWVIEENIALPQNRSRRWFIDPRTKEYNGCHFWSNFEIGSLKMLRSPQYRSYFNYLDKKGGFYYERWGDAPVHSLYAAIALNKQEIHFFENIGYKHDEYQHCPSSKQMSKKCKCNPEKNSEFDEGCYGDFFKEIGYKPNP